MSSGQWSNDNSFKLWRKWLILCINLPRNGRLNGPCGVFHLSPERCLSGWFQTWKGICLLQEHFKENWQWKAKAWPLIQVLSELPISIITFWRHSKYMYLNIAILTPVVIIRGILGYSEVNASWFTANWPILICK